MLLKPWRNIVIDLKNTEQTWKEAFDVFVNEPSSQRKRVKDILSGIQYFHDCESSADSDQRSWDGSGQSGVLDIDAEELAGELGEQFEVEVTEEALQDAIAAQTPINEALHARFAVEIARQAKIFRNDDSEWPIPVPSHVGNASGDDLTRLLEWKRQFERDVAIQNAGYDPPTLERSLDPGSVAPLTQSEIHQNSHGTVIPLARTAMSEAALEAVDVIALGKDQRRAYDIIIWHLDQTLRAWNPPPLRMLVHGEGGTGKSKVIQTVTEGFKTRGAQYMLIKAAYTGVAASLIDGKTTHAIGGISLFGDEAQLTAEGKAKLQQFWKHKCYLILDEYSMLAKDFFSLLSRNVGIGKEGSKDVAHSQSFGGINVIICGDLHQFPPVARPLHSALYYPSDQVRDSIDSQLGRAIYEEFSTVVTLKEQMRVTDSVWHEFLQHLRHGRVQEHHLSLLRSLIVGKTPEMNVNFREEPWRSASLVTPRHAVRTEWNEAATRKICSESHSQLFVCTANDTIGGRPLTLHESYMLESRHNGTSRTQKRRSKDLAREVKLAIGMKVMVTDNIETDLDITNGARGEIVDIILHPDEPPIDDSPIVHLRCMPLYILVKLTRTRATPLDGLQVNVIPIEPGISTYRIKIQQKEGHTMQKSVRRRQFPMTAAYAFTDYRSQGQTLPYVIIDIASPPTGTLSLFNLYVALSRSSGRASIRLLRDFDDKLFMASHDPALVDEDERLENLNIQTKLWYERMVEIDAIRAA
jgi:hypothetical protein